MKDRQGKERALEGGYNSGRDDPLLAGYETVYVYIRPGRRVFFETFRNSPLLYKMRFYTIDGYESLTDMLLKLQCDMRAFVAAHEAAKRGALPFAEFEALHYPGQEGE